MLLLGKDYLMYIFYGNITLIIFGLSYHMPSLLFLTKTVDVLGVSEGRKDE